MKEDILDQLIEKAKQESKWLYCGAINLWLSPEELEEHNKNGRFQLAPANWQLRDPSELIKEKEDKISEMQKELDTIKNRVLQWEKNK